ncbi:MAG: PSD1 and planctomycete cytochrome C domain-containing protein [Pirellulales bacterium]
MHKATQLSIPLLLACSVSQGAEHVDFTKDILPVLQRHCFECHGPGVQEGGLRFDDRNEFLSGGYSGPAIISNKPRESELLRRVSLDRLHDDAMPPVGPGLSDREEIILRQWIQQGGDLPDTIPRQKHWAYVPPVRHSSPSAGSQDLSIIDPTIDGWIVAAHKDEGLQFAPVAKKSQLIRRLAFDVTGLPPSPEVVAAFEADDRDDAYKNLVDELLQSEEFGVRWARMWLDLARYADSHGFQRDDLRNMWAYRDWVVDALNDDMPFDQFTITQIAGDLLPDANEATRIATGFHRCAPTNVEAGTDPEESRINQVFDRVNTTAAIWLGVTLECAQCHDHKYDPFSQEEYYRFAAYFNSTEAEAERANPKVPSSIKFIGPSMNLSHDPWETERKGIDQSLSDARKDVKKFKGGKTEKDVIQDESKQPTTCGGETFVDQQDQQDDADARLKTMEKKVRQLQNKLASIPEAKTLVMQERAKPRETFVLNRGDFTDPLRQVDAGTPGVLGGTTEGLANRLMLAKWLVSQDNPLTARVFVNRVWFEIFGQGIVTTLEDFGVKGERPTHPELLDSLAVEFMEDGWSLKKLVRRIVTSRTYRQSSTVTSKKRLQDIQNKWLARGPRFRLDAEGIRDNALTIAGLLSTEKGGPSIRPPQPNGLWTKLGGQKYIYEVSPGEQQYRRGIYVVLKRGSPYPSFMTFDATERMTCVTRRSRSNTPLQSLVLLNDPVYTEAAFAFGKRMLSESPEDTDTSRIDYGFCIAVSRQPTVREVNLLQKLLNSERQELLANPKKVEVIIKDHSGIDIPESMDSNELAAWYVIAATILNLDETITKN